MLNGKQTVLIIYLLLNVKGWMKFQERQANVYICVFLYFYIKK